MSESGPEDPFGGIPFLEDLARMLQSQAGAGAGGWESARQLAVQIATGGEPEDNPDPIDRIAVQELARVAELQVGNATGLDVAQTGRPLTVVPVTRGEWARRTIDAWRPLLERLSQSMTGPVLSQGLDLGDDDPEAAMFGPLLAMMGPMMLGLQAGSMVGHLASRSLGQYDLPIPRPPSDELVLVAHNVATFGDEWSLPRDDLRLWICLSDVATHAVIGVPHVRDRLWSLLERHVSSFSLDTSGIEEALASLDVTDPEALQQAFADPTALLGAIQSSARESLLPELSALAAVIVGYVDHVMDTVGESLIGSYGMLTEALHRRRVEAAAADQFVDNLLGLELGREQYERGEEFVKGVLERGGDINRLFMSPEDLPTPNEVDAPGLWLARIDL
jgi:putative hydrolase